MSKHKRFYLLYLLFYLTMGPISAQDKISFIQEELRFTIADEKRLDKLDFNHLGKKTRNLEIKSLRLNNGDLMIEYQLSPYNFEFEDSIMITHLLLEKLSGNDINEPPYQIDSEGQKWLLEDITVPRADTGAKSLTWMGLQERSNFSLQGNYRLQLYAVGIGKLPITCDADYTFNLNKQLPHLIAGILGVGSFALSYVPQSNAVNIYENQYLPRPIDDSETREIYAKANSKRHEYLIMKYGGIVVVGADLLWYYLRSRNLKRKRDIQSRYCSEKDQLISISPVLDFDSRGIGLSQVGIGLKIRLAN